MDGVLMLDFCEHCGATWWCEHRGSEAEAAGMVPYGWSLEEQQAAVWQWQVKPYVDAIESAREGLEQFASAFAETFGPMVQQVAASIKETFEVLDVKWPNWREDLERASAEAGNNDA